MMHRFRGNRSRLASAALLLALLLVPLAGDAVAAPPDPSAAQAAETVDESAFQAYFEQYTRATGLTPAQTGLFSFDRKSFAANYPTSLAFGPDDRLYYTEATGAVRRVTLTESYDVVSNEVIATFSGRLVRGIAVDWSVSTPQSIVLWIAHSDGNAQNAALNSGAISKLTGPSWTREDVITGLPRAITNHSTNSLQVRAGRLYIAQGSNTGAGAANNLSSGFGTRAEQPLSAALLVAEVSKPGFDGTCATTEGSPAPAPCDVQPYATGIRNMYDFVFHSNGLLYGPDNGAGTNSTYPPAPAPPCTGLGGPAQSPAPQPDVLLLLEQGRYYGHPNPYRGECVFKDGSLQGAPPLSTYTAPILNLGTHQSAGGIIEYRSGAFAGLLRGSLLITDSAGGTITRVKLSPDGRSVELYEPLAVGLTNPLPLVANPKGAIWAGEYGPAASTGKITALVPKLIGGWVGRQKLPASRAGAGSAVLDGKLYVIAGKDASGPKKAVTVYDPVANEWTAAAPLPSGYPAVESPAVATDGSKIFVFGGSTQEFTGAVDHAASYDPGTGEWTMLEPVPTPRGGATARALGRWIYVMGGLSGSGASLDTVEIFDTQSGAWSAGPAMNTRRDGAASASLGGKIYIFGGRTRSATGQEVGATPNSVEMFDPDTDEWTFRKPMPTGRRGAVSGHLSAKIQIAGGENNNGVLNDNEEYNPGADAWRVLMPMPTARSRAAGGSIGSVTFVVGGNTSSGLSPTDVHQSFSFATQIVHYQLKVYLPLVRK